MCHNVAGAGGALTEGKFAPPLGGVTEAHIYEAMVTGPQNMPVFNDLNISPEDKRDIISYLKYIEANPSPGGFALGSLGPVAEGLFLWIFGLGAIVAPDGVDHRPIQLDDCSALTGATDPRHRLVPTRREKENHGRAR